MTEIKGKLIAIGGAEDKGTEVVKLLSIHHNLNFFGLGILRRIVEEAGGIMATNRSDNHCINDTF